MMLSRSLLFVPADKEKMLYKINQLKADGVILDLEDAVANDNKSLARELIKQYIIDMNTSVFIRVNSIETSDFKKDMELIKSISHLENLQGIVLAKSNSEQCILQLNDYLNKYENYDFKNNKIKIIPLIEDALGVYNIDEIIKASDRIARVAFGAEDFTEDIGAEKTPKQEELLFAKSKLILSSRVHKIEKPIDTVYTDFTDITGFKESVLHSKRLGFGGRLLIHPNQVEVANEYFAPSIEEVTLAKEIIKHAKKNKGAFNLNGKMIDKPIITRAENTIKQYNLIHTI